MASLSEKLRRERELRGISLKQISEDTKIGVRFLEALEENELERIPGEFYRRSYLRAYARYLGLDEDRALNAYTYSRNESPSESERTAETASDAETVPWGRIAAGVLVIAVAAGFLLLRSRTSATDDPAPAAAETVPASASASPAEAEVPAVELVPSSATVAPSEGLEPIDESAPLRLVLAVNEACWLEIEADGVVVATGLKKEGFRQTLTARNEVRLWLGNAGGVALWVNERPAKPLGGEGQVRKDVTITPANVGDFVSGAEDLS